MGKRSLVTVIAVAIAILLLVLAIDGRARFPMLDRAVVAIVTPVNEQFVALSKKADSVRNFFAALTTMQEENIKLQTEVEELRHANLKMAELWAENKRLSELLGYKNEAKNLTLIAAKVVGRNMGDTNDSVIINIGKSAGIKSNMPVVNAKGLVGIVEEVHDSVARVQLITSPRCKVGGIVLRANSRVAGVVSGMTGADGPLVMGNMARDADIEEGDIIATSGLGGNHPGGLIIGKVASVGLNFGGLLKQARIIPTVDFLLLEEVMVVTDYKNPSSLVPAGVNETKKQGGER